MSLEYNIFTQMNSEYNLFTWHTESSGRAVSWRGQSLRDGSGQEGFSATNG